jgi:hypothetical protein
MIVFGQASDATNVSVTHRLCGVGYLGEHGVKGVVYVRVSRTATCCGANDE